MIHRLSFTVVYSHHRCPPIVPLLVNRFTGNVQEVNIVVYCFESPNLKSYSTPITALTSGQQLAMETFFAHCHISN